LFKIAYYFPFFEVAKKEAKRKEMKKAEKEEGRKIQNREKLLGEHHRERKDTRK
jgi:hypothetical protein